MYLCTPRNIGSLASFEHAVVDVTSPFGWEFLTFYHFTGDNFLVMGKEIITWGVTSCLCVISVDILHGEPWPITDFISRSLGVATDNSRKVVLSVLDHLFLQDGCTIPMRPHQRQRTAVLLLPLSPEESVCAQCQSLAVVFVGSWIILEYSPATQQRWATAGRAWGFHNRHLHKSLLLQGVFVCEQCWTN